MRNYLHGARYTFCFVKLVRERAAKAHESGLQRKSRLAADRVRNGAARRCRRVVRLVVDHLYARAGRRLDVMGSEWVVVRNPRDLAEEPLAGGYRRGIPGVVLRQSLAWQRGRQTADAALYEAKAAGRNTYRIAG